MTAVVLADAWRIAFLVLGAPVIGAALMRLIGEVTGGRWPAAEAPARLLPLAALGAAVLGLAQAATPVPAHLGWWLNPFFVAARGAAVLLALGWAVRRPRSVTGAAVTLAAYAWAVTPIASDWLLGGVPGHSVSAAGMMLVCQEVAAACALPLAVGTGGARERQDLARLMIAAALGSGYLAFMDYLIIWFGNLPARVGFYAARAGEAPFLVTGALLLGWAVPIVLLARGDEAGRRGAGAAVLAALLLLDLWWVTADLAAMAVAVLVIVAFGTGGWAAWQRREAVHGRA